MSITAMKQALEALEFASSQYHYRCQETVTVLRQAIEQAEKQEPVAWRHSNTCCLYETFEEVPLADGDEWPEPLYTTPQPQRELNCVCGAVWEGDEMVYVPHKREWVGLTEEEREELMDNYDVASPDYAKAIEAKLKDKNT